MGIWSERRTDVLVVGGGLGGIAAALAALKMGRRVIVTEETHWIGGQLTAQAVPPDEHPWIEETGCTASYRRLRELVRDYYRRNHALTYAARTEARLNPGQGKVSRLCCEPRVALAALEQMLAPYRTGGALRVLTRHRPVSVHESGDEVSSVTLLDESDGCSVAIHADYVLDATELGDLLALGNVEHVIGSESREMTGEPHALPGAADPLDQQAVTWCFAMDTAAGDPAAVVTAVGDAAAGEENTIEKPEMYDFWCEYRPDFWPDRLFGWTDADPVTLEPRYKALFEGQGLGGGGSNYWIYRQIVAASHHTGEIPVGDVTLVNWPQIDYFQRPLVGVSEEQREKALYEARQQSLSFFYWMQHDAPRHDGGTGYPELRLRPDLLGTTHGLAQQVYIRESRRIQAELTVKEQDVGVEAREGSVGAAFFPDSVGVGSYRIDLHPSTGGRNYVDINSWPFQIPLGALIPVRVENLLPACKNIGTTHITNGCYRMHPTEWNIGEAAGALAAFCLNRGCRPRQVRAKKKLLDEYLGLLMGKLGFVLEWPENIRTTPRDPSWNHPPRITPPT